MLRTALIRSAGVARRTLRPSSVATIRRLAAPSVPSAVPSFALRAAGWAAVRSYSSGSGLKKEEVEGRIMALLHNFDKVNDPANIKSSAHFANDLGLDSLDTVEVVMAIEEEFSIEIPDKDADTIHSIDKAVEYILSQPDAN